MDSPSFPVCPRCGEPRVLAAECPRCGVIYARARAEARVTASPEADAAPLSLPEAPTYPSVFPPAQPLTWGGDLEEARHELRVRAIALPAALLGAWLVVKSPLWGGVLRVFLSMWIHELGHAVTAWLCGFPAFPGPWLTRISEERSGFLIALLAGGLLALVFRGHVTQRRPLVVAGVVGLVLQLLGTAGLSAHKAQVLIIFGGDGGCLVLGTLLMTSLYAPRDSALRKGWLHWGYLVIGAAAFMDAFSQWWAARHDFALIPFGENEGVGLSDPSKLVDVYGWGELELIHRYTALGLVCLAVLGVLYAGGLVRARAALRTLESAPRP